MSIDESGTFFRQLTSKLKSKYTFYIDVFYCVYRHRAYKYIFIYYM